MTDGKKNQLKYIQEYTKQNYDRITILRPKGEKEILTNIAKQKGYKTLTAFINTCIDEKIKRMKIDLTQYQDKADPLDRSP